MAMKQQHKASCFQLRWTSLNSVDDLAEYFILLK